MIKHSESFFGTGHSAAPVEELEELAPGTACSRPAVLLTHNEIASASRELQLGVIIDHDTWLSGRILGTCCAVVLVVVCWVLSAVCA